MPRSHPQTGWFLRAVGSWMVVGFLLSIATSTGVLSSAHGSEPGRELIDWKHARPAGSLVIVGGGMRFNDPPIWEEIVSLAHEFGLKEEGSKRERPRVVVFGTASGNPARAGERHVNALIRYGADAVLSPLVAPGAPPIATCDEATLDAIAAQVKAAQGVFFTGGEQARILAALRTAAGEPNVVLTAILDLYRRGGVIAGTSAGAAVMSRIAYRDAEFVLPTLVSGVRMGREIDHGLGVMHPDWFIDQHCLIRGRFARSLVVMHQQDFKYGLGIDENTALVVQGNDVRIVGYKGAILLDASAAKRDANERRFHWQGVKLSYLDRGDKLNLGSLSITPAMEKLGGHKIDPASADFKPYYKVPLVSNDILGNTTLIDMMVRLLDSTDDQGLGLAFDGHAAQHGVTPGFVFRFYRGPGTLAWSTGDFGGEDFTVQDVYLDIQPRDVGPLFK